MKTVQEIKVLKSALSNARSAFSRVGLVPTMGALHRGHLALIQAAKSQCDFVIASIFVNPIQFNQPSDFENYPQTLEDDLKVLEGQGVDMVFMPSIKEMYPSSLGVSLSFSHLEKILEGKFRPGHFNGVGIVVAKLLHLVDPHVAFFGQKDLQQVHVIKALVVGLSFDVEVEVVPTVREDDGLAFSSRNIRLGKVEREKAPHLYEALVQAEQDLKTGQPWSHVKNSCRKSLENSGLVELEYLALVRLPEFRLSEKYEANSEFALCIAAYLGGVRLIDNVIIRPTS